LQKELNMANAAITKLQKDNEHVRNELSSCKDELDRIHETLIYRIYLRARTILSNVNKKQK
jgi:hypothetical protein